MGSTEDLLHGAIAVAEAAAEAILQVYRSDQFAETRKADASHLTLADLAAHRVIVAGLRALTPSIPVLSEEATALPAVERAGWTRFWLVDPLDGTREFIKRNDEFTVNIALIENGAPVLGVVQAPALGMVYYAARGAGAFVRRSAETHPIRAQRLAAGRPMRVVASRSHADARTAALLAGLGAHRCIGMGSSLKLCLVAEGEADLYPRLGPTMEWDTAAAHAVVSEAGGALCDLLGAELRYNKPDLHNPEFLVCHAEDKQRLQELVGSILLQPAVGQDAGQVSRQPEKIDVTTERQ